MTPNKKKPATRGNAGRASKSCCLAAERFEATPNATYLQVSYLARRFGVAPALASLIAEIAFDCGRRA